MDKELLEGMLIDYIDGTLSEADRVKVEQEIAKNEEAYRLYEQLREVITAMDKSEKFEPGANIKVEFEKAIQRELAKSKQGKTVFFQPAYLRIAAAILLVISGIAIGNWISKNNAREEQIAKLQQ